MSISETLKFFREGIPMTQKNFCSEIISASYYAKVESGNSNISADLLFQLLKKNNISVTEFFFKVSNSTEEIYVSKFKNIRKAYYTTDIEELTLQKESLEKEDIFYSISLLLIQKKKGEKLNIVEINKIESKLLDTNIWREYHIMIFILSTKILSADQLLLISSTFFKSMKEASLYTLYEKDLILATLNIVQTCLESKMFEEAAYFLMISKRVMGSSIYLLEKTIIDFYENIIALTADRPYSEKLKKCKEIIELLERYQMGQVPKLLQKTLDIAIEN